LLPQLAELRTRADTVIEYDFHLMHRKGLFLARTGCSRQRSGASAVGREPDIGVSRFGWAVSDLKQKKVNGCPK
jgi:hypothetical protein